MICFDMFFIKDCRIVLSFVIYVMDEVKNCCFRLVIFDVEMFWFIKCVILFFSLWSLENNFVELVLVSVWKWLVSLFWIVNFNIVILLFRFCILLEFNMFLLFIIDFNFFVKLKIVCVWLVIVDWILFSFLFFFCKLFLIWIIFFIRKIKMFLCEMLVSVVFGCLLILFKRSLWIKIKYRVKRRIIVVRFVILLIELL